MSLRTHATKVHLVALTPTGAVSQVSLNVIGAPASAVITANHRAHAPPLCC
jgi:hypothetical protein